jgi:nanoRNase/pAp phosphatase (c-di-AMP/oligoRNAs hydrolase)
MDYETALQKAKEMVMAAKDVVVVTHANPTMDSIGGSLALMLGLASLGKQSTVICPDAMTVGLSSFVGVDKVSRQFGKKNFVVSLDYEDGSIEKVSYNIEGKKFNLVVEHRPGFEPMTSDKVAYSYQGVSADLIITVDTLNFGQLGGMYEQQKASFAGKQIINIDFHNANANYGVINLVDPAASSTSELVAEFLATLGVKLTTDIATNLLNAIYSATNNFQNDNVTSMAFEVASVCLKAGAKRFGASDDGRRFASQPASSPSMDMPMSAQPAPQPVATDIQAQVAPMPQQHVQPQQSHTPQPPQPKQPPSDWLKPKIFKSSGQLS